MKAFVRFFDRLEDKSRAFLSHYPMLYAIIGGVAVVLFWRGVWGLADQYNISAFSSLIISVAIMMVTGLFVSFFIGDRIILSGLKHEKKLAEKTEEEIKAEETILINVASRLERMEKDLTAIRERMDR